MRKKLDHFIYENSFFFLKKKQLDTRNRVRSLIQ